MAEMEAAPTAYFEGKFVPTGEAKVSILTHAFNYGTGLFEGIEQDARLDASAAAELQQVAAAPHVFRDLAGMLLEERGLGAGRVVLVEAADLLKQFGAALVVEELAG